MDLAEFLLKTERPVLFDGGMGTELARTGLEMGGQNCISHPEGVLAIHREYIGSGADLIITNTLTMNRVYLESHDLDVDVRKVNLAGAGLARKAVGEAQYVLGDMGSTGKMLQPYGDLSREDAFKAYQEQAKLLVEGGVDGLIIETMFDLQEALCALEACKAVTDLPLLVSMSFSTTDNGGRTIMGNTARDCAQALTEAEAFAVGTNCGDLDPFQMAEIVTMMREAVSVPILAQPNAGKPRLLDKETVFDMSPSDFAEGVYQCREAGARLLGGCCGTTPAHIRALREKLG